MRKERAMTQAFHVVVSRAQALSSMRHSVFNACSGKSVLPALLIACNLILFGLVQSRDVQFYQGDFKMFYTAAKALRSGQDIYNPEVYAPLQRQVVPSLILSSVKPYTHPPYELIGILPFSFLDYTTACWCWLLVTLGLGIFCGRLLGSYAAVLAMFPFFIVMLEQQDSMLALLVILSAWFALKRDCDVLAGFILGFALFKFQVVIPLAVILSLWRPRLLRGFAVSGVIVAAASIVMVRLEGMVGYWHYLLGMVRASSAPVSAYHMDPNQNVALRGFIYVLIGAHDHLAAVVTISLGVLILGFAFGFMRNGGLAPETKFSYAVIGSLLLSFHLLTHDLIFLALPLVLLGGSVARWPLFGLYFAPIPVLYVTRESAWLAVLPMCSLVLLLALAHTRATGTDRKRDRNREVARGECPAGSRRLTAVRTHLFESPLPRYAVRERRLLAK
jgi:hypothetical protein